METTREIGTEDGTGKLRVTLETNFGSTRVGSITCLEFRECVSGHFSGQKWIDREGLGGRDLATRQRENAIIKRNHVISNPGMKACAWNTLEFFCSPKKCNQRLEVFIYIEQLKLTQNFQKLTSVNLLSRPPPPPCQKRFRRQRKW